MACKLKPAGTVASCCCTFLVRENCAICECAPSQSCPTPQDLRGSRLWHWTGANVASQAYPSLAEHLPPTQFTLAYGRDRARVRLLVGIGRWEHPHIRRKAIKVTSISRGIEGMNILLTNTGRAFCRCLKRMPGFEGLWLGCPPLSSKTSLIGSDVNA
jgi:hypothetical protein